MQIDTLRSVSLNSKVTAAVLKILCNVLGFKLTDLYKIYYRISSNALHHSLLTIIITPFIDSFIIVVLVGKIVEQER